MYAQVYSQFKPLSAIVPDEIDWLNTDLMAATMGISLGQLRRDVVTLRKLELIQLEEVTRETQLTEMFPNRKKPFRCRRKGFTREEAQVIWLFRQAVRQRGRIPAIKSIIQTIEDYFNDYSI